MIIYIKNNYYLINNQIIKNNKINKKMNQKNNQRMNKRRNWNIIRIQKQLININKIQKFKIRNNYLIINYKINYKNDKYNMYIILFIYKSNFIIL